MRLDLINECRIIFHFTVFYKCNISRVSFALIRIIKSLSTLGQIQTVSSSMIFGLQFAQGTTFKLVKA